jgi:hypothetical protein
MSRTIELAFEIVLEASLRADGYTALTREGYDREKTIFLDAVLDFCSSRHLAEQLLVHHS